MKDREDVAAPFPSPEIDRDCSGPKWLRPLSRLLRIDSIPSICQFGVRQEKPFESQDEKTEHLQAKTFNRQWHTGSPWRMLVRHCIIVLVLFSTAVLPVLITERVLWKIILNKTMFPMTVFATFFPYDCMGSTGWSFIGIDMVVGQFSYGQAKTLDLAWNWIVGRCLQGVLTLFSYRVFTDALMRAAELDPLPYELFASLAFYSASTDVLWQLVKSLRLRGGWRVKAIFTYLLLSTAYLVTFPRSVPVHSSRT